MQFEWDEKKAADNIKKHGIVFNDAAFVFADEHRIEWFDNRQDYGEDRFNTVGMVFGVLLCVCYTMRNYSRFIAKLFCVGSPCRIIHILSAASPP